MQIFQFFILLVIDVYQKKGMFQTWRLNDLLAQNLFSTEINADNDSPIWESHFILVKDIEFYKEIILGNTFDNNGREEKNYRRPKPNNIAFEQVL